MKHTKREISTECLIAGKQECAIVLNNFFFWFLLIRTGAVLLCKIIQLIMYSFYTDTFSHSLFPCICRGISVELTYSEKLMLQEISLSIMSKSVYEQLASGSASDSDVPPTCHAVTCTSQRTSKFVSCPTKPVIFHTNTPQAMRAFARTVQEVG